MDAFFTIASPVPVEEPAGAEFTDYDSVGTSGNSGSCVIA
ncbi:pheromone [Trametes versicolor FP-101664 SS1]|nr:pheromone [Trametes versicolor FP-101664 SS1]EIW57103.1 pheromone [Trametes versicolor FP-101664 SS1]